MKDKTYLQELISNIRRVPGIELKSDRSEKLVFVYDKNIDIDTDDQYIVNLLATFWFKGFDEQPSAQLRIFRNRVTNKFHYTVDISKTKIGDSDLITGSFGITQDMKKIEIFNVPADSQLILFKEHQIDCDEANGLEFIVIRIYSN